MYGPTATPIFDTVAREFKEREGFDLFTVVWMNDDGHDFTGEPLPEFNDFDTSFMKEWMIYHRSADVGAEQLAPWLGHSESLKTTAIEGVLDALRNRSMVILPEDQPDEWYEGRHTEPERQTIAKAMALMAAPKSNKALDTVMDVIFGDAPRVKTFDELNEFQLKDLMSQAIEDLKDVENYSQSELTPQIVLDKARDMYEASPIKMYHVPSYSMQDADEEPQPSLVDISEAIQVGVETGVIQVEVAADEEGNPDAPMFGVHSNFKDWEEVIELNEQEIMRVEGISRKELHRRMSAAQQEEAEETEIEKTALDEAVAPLDEQPTETIPNPFWKND